MIIYPAGPYPPVEPGNYGEPNSYKIEGKNPLTAKLKGKVLDLRMRPGEGIRAQPFESKALFDFTTDMGGVTGLFYGLTFTFGKWGYDSKMVDHSIEVTPVFTEYYERTMNEKRRIEEQIKNGFASLTSAVSDYELLWHDVRKYKEYLDYYKAIMEAGIELEKAKKSKDEAKIKSAEKNLRERHHILRALFVDHVDAGSPEGVSLRSIAPRWPTIISDFMVLDESDTVDSIMKRLDVPRAEAVVLYTKNNLYNSWKNEMFIPAIAERYKGLRQQMESRKVSIEQYRNQIRPLLSRYFAIKEMRESGMTGWDRASFFRPDAQAASVDSAEVWAWRPFASPDFYKPPREIIDTVTLKEAGFYNLLEAYKEDEERIKELKEQLSKIGGLSGTIKALPAIPIVDKHLISVILQIEDQYNVKITPDIIANTIKSLAGRYSTPEYGAQGIAWQWSPYFVFIRVPMDRTVLKFPNGAMFEDLWIENLQTMNTTQNVMLGRMLELYAKDEVIKRKISTLLGEDVITKEDSYVSIEESVKSEFKMVYEEEEWKKKQLEGEKKKIKTIFEDWNVKMEKFRKDFGKYSAKFADLTHKLAGVEMYFAYSGPYEKLMHDRMAKMMQLGPGLAFITVEQFLKKGAGVPGVEPKLWI